MRMWSVNPKMLCDKHLLGEHVEMHMFVGTINKGISIQGYLDKKLVNPIMIHKRHNALVKEMESRGMNHNSPLPKHSCKIMNRVDIDGNTRDLINRCPNCKERIEA